MKALPVFVIVVLLSLNANAQPHKDSLYQAYLKAPHDTGKVNCLVLLSAAETNTDSSLMWAEKALQLSRKIKFRNGEGKIRVSAAKKTPAKLEGDEAVKRTPGNIH